MADITIERRLPVINGFVEIPDGKGLRVTPAEALALIPGSTLVRLGGSTVSEIQIIGEGEETPTPFKNDHAFSFNGIDNYGQAILPTVDGAVPNFMGDGGYSISLWIKSSDFQSLSYNKILTLRKGTDFIITINMSQGGNWWGGGLVRFQEGNTPASYISSSKLIDNSWNHILVTSTSTVLKSGILSMYLNGVLISTGNGDKATLININTVTVASYPQGGWFTKMSFDGIAMWNTALTSEQVTDIYSNGKATNLSSLSTNDNLKIWWRFGDGSGDNPSSIVYDQAGSSDLTCYNMDASNRIDGVPASPNAITAVAISNTARQHQGDLFIQLPAYSSTTTALTVDLFEQLRTGVVPTAPTPPPSAPQWSNTKSVYFNGIADYYIGDSAITQAPETPFSLSMWFKVASGATPNDYLIPGGILNASESGAYACGIWTRLTLGGVLPWFDPATMWGYVSSGPGSTGNVSFSPFVWNHVVLTHSYVGTPSYTQTSKLYINGALEITKTAWASLATINQKLILGTSSITWGFFDGHIDEVSVYVGAELDLNEVQEIYNGTPGMAGTGTPTDLTTGPQTASLKHWYRMGDDPGDSPNVLIDQIPGGINMSAGSSPIIDTDVP